MSRSHSVREIAAFSRSLLDCALRAPRALTIVVANDEGKIAGAFGLEESRSEPRSYARGSGGPTLDVGEESVYIALNCESAHALDPALPVSSDASRVINRGVRPLLRALKKCGLASAMYGDRDFVAQKGAPFAWVGFQHDAVTNRVAFEAFVATCAPLEPAGRATFRDRAPVSLRELKCELTGEDVATRIANAYTSAFPDLATESLPRVAISDDGKAGALGGAALLTLESAASLILEDDAIGRVGVRRAPRGELTIHGDFQASRDFIARANATLSHAKSADEACALLDDAASAERVVVFGLTSLDSLKRALRRAFA